MTNRDGDEWRFVRLEDRADEIRLSLARRKRQKMVLR